MQKRNILFSGFMLFSLFFGAGNLIFPPMLGLESGNSFGPAITGFLITGVLLPVIAIMAISLSENGLISIGNRVHKIFGLIFAIIIYMSIGAFYGIPRAANVAYELGFGQLFSADNRFVLFVFSTLFFGVTYFISFNPKKIVDRIGQVLTPVLLIVLSILFVKTFMKFDLFSSPAEGAYVTTPFVTGFLEGYFTMDAVAALAFGIVVINGLKDKGAQTKQDIVKGALGASILAGLALTVVYFCLGWIGRVIPEDVAFSNGAEVLTVGSKLLFVKGGSLLFGVIVILACLTTCVGLINACSQFFHDIYPKFSYQTYVAAFVLIGLLVSNLGLTVILELAKPLLVFIYPIAIVLVILSLLEHVIGGSKLMYQFSVIVTGIYAMYETLVSVGIEFKFVEQVLGIVPFFEDGLGWTVPALIAGCIGYGMDTFKTSE